MKLGQTFSNRLPIDYQMTTNRFSSGFQSFLSQINWLTNDFQSMHSIFTRAVLTLDVTEWYNQSWVQFIAQAIISNVCLFSVSNINESIKVFVRTMRIWKSHHWKLSWLCCEFWDLHDFSFVQGKKWCLMN